MQQLREYLERRQQPRICDDGVERIAVRAWQCVGPRHLRSMVLDQRQRDRDLPDRRPEVLLVEHVGDLIARQRGSRARTDVDHGVLRDQQIAAILVAVPLVLDQQGLAVALGRRDDRLVLVVEVEKVLDGRRAEDLIALDRLVDVELAGVNDPWPHHMPNRLRRPYAAHGQVTWTLILRPHSNDRPFGPAGRAIPIAARAQIRTACRACRTIPRETRFASTRRAASDFLGWDRCP